MNPDGNRVDRRKRTWEDSHFQSRQMLLVVGAVIAAFVSIGAVHLQALAEQKDLLALAQAELPRTLLLGAITLVLIAILAFIAIRSSFRAVGPVVAVSRMLRAMAAGNFRALRKLRRNDEFRFLEEDLFALRDSLKNDSQADAALLQNVIAVLESLDLGSKEAGMRRAELIATVAIALRAKEDRFGLGAPSTEVAGVGSAV
jgi:methyl-accepting chemotaxis protein